MPATRAQRPPRRSFRNRLRDAFATEAEGDEPSAAEAETAPEPEPTPRERPERERPPEREPPPPRRRHESRHIRAVPTTAEVKVERALELFNDSDHPRTIAGIARTLGQPWVHASPDGGQPSEVTIVVAWELSWYRYRVDLGDEHEPILLLEKGDELAELEEPLRAWNSVADENGRLSADVGSAP